MVLGRFCDGHATEKGPQDSCERPFWKRRRLTVRVPEGVPERSPFAGLRRSFGALGRKSNVAGTSQLRLSVKSTPVKNELQTGEIGGARTVVFQSLRVLVGFRGLSPF